MATVVGDSINYGIDEDGAGVHDVIGEIYFYYPIVRLSTVSPLLAG